MREPGETGSGAERALSQVKADGAEDRDGVWGSVAWGGDGESSHRGRAANCECGLVNRKAWIEEVGDGGWAGTLKGVLIWVEPAGTQEVQSWEDQQGQSKPRLGGTNGDSGKFPKSRFSSFTAAGKWPGLQSQSSRSTSTPSGRVLLWSDVSLGSGFGAVGLTGTLSAAGSG